MNLVEIIVVLFVGMVIGFIVTHIKYKHTIRKLLLKKFNKVNFENDITKTKKWTDEQILDSIAPNFKKIYQLIEELDEYASIEYLPPTYLSIFNGIRNELVWYILTYQDLFGRIIKIYQENPSRNIKEAFDVETIRTELFKRLK